jgi:hypothetical protein
MLRVGEASGNFAGKAIGDEMLAVWGVSVKNEGALACALTVRTASLGPACDGRGAKWSLVYDAANDRVAGETHRTNTDSRWQRHA